MIETTNYSRKSKITKLLTRAPLRFLQSEESEESAVVYLIRHPGSFTQDGGSMSVNVGESTTLYLKSQKPLKVFRPRKEMQNPECLVAHVGDNALFLALMDPVICYKSSVFEQERKVFLENDSSSLCMIDWFASGQKIGQGDIWQQERISTRNSVFLYGSLLVSDSLDMQSSDSTISSKLGAFTVIGSLILVGTRTVDSQIQVLKYCQKNTDEVVEGGVAPTDFFMSASAINGGIVCRFAAYSTEIVYSMLGMLLGINSLSSHSTL